MILIQHDSSEYHEGHVSLMYQLRRCHLDSGSSELKIQLESNPQRALDTGITIIAHPQAIISNALDDILLIVDSSDPNLY